MTKRTGRVAWGLVVVLGAVLAGSIGLALTRPIEMKLGRWTVCGNVIDTSIWMPYMSNGVKVTDGYLVGQEGRQCMVRMGDFVYVVIWTREQP